MPSTTQSHGLATLAYPFYAVQSGDVRPIPTDADATLYEVDTRRWYVWRAGEWHLFSAPPGAADDSLLRAILSELRKVRRGLELALNTELPDTGE